MRARSALVPPRLGMGALAAAPVSVLGPPPSKMFLMGRGTYPYAITSAPPLGADGSIDEKWNGSVWSATNNPDAGIVWGTLMASCCYDAATGLVFGFGNWDFTGHSWVYNTATDDYTAITATPSSAGGSATLALCYSGNCYIFGGGKADGQPGGTFSMSTSILRYPINAGTPSQSYTTLSAVMPYAGKDIVGCIDSQNANIAYLGGGSTDTTDPPDPSTAVATWLKYDFSSPNSNPVAMTSIPTGLAQAACVDIGSEILLIGGCVTGTSNTCGTNTVRAYNKAGNSWSTKTNYPLNVACARAVFWNGVIYCAGGFNSSGWHIGDDPPNATSAVYQSSDLGASWQLHSNLVDVLITGGTYSGQSKGAKASGGMLLVAM